MEFPNNRNGLRFLDTLFFNARSKTKKKGISWYEAQQNPEIMQKLEVVSKRIKNKSLYAVFQLWYGTVNQFKPCIAEFIYDKYKPTSVLDFSAGWGGRCLGAINKKIPYIGIDTNTDLQDGYRGLKEQYPDADFTIHYQPSETFDYTSVSYDMIFTSPPYFTLEKYQNMPEYTDKNDFITKFFIPVIVASWASLTQGGHLVLNMPETLYLVIKDLLPPLYETLQMPISSRFAKTSKDKRFEYIYVWCKL